MAEFLHDESPARIEHHVDVRTDVKTDLHDQNEHPDAENAPGAVHLFGRDQMETRETEDRAENESIKKREQHDEAEALNADPLGNDDDDESHQVQFEVSDEVHGGVFR